MSNWSSETASLLKHFHISRGDQFEREQSVVRMAAPEWKIVTPLIGLLVHAAIQNSILVIVPFVLLLLLLLLQLNKKHVHLLDFAVFEPPEEWKVSHKDIGKIIRNLSSERKRRGLAHHSELDAQFQQKILANSGTGDATAWPPAIVQYRDENDNEIPKHFIRMKHTREEAETILFQCMDKLLVKTRIKPQKIDCLIVNCSLFSPTPSLCAMICQRYGLNAEVKTYNLSGQGCSASVIAVDLARDFLKSNSHSNVVVLSTELISESIYHGHEKSMLIQNTLFRSGGAAIMLSNKWYYIGASKYSLHSLCRTQVSDDESYKSVYETEDEEGNKGIALSKKITDVAGKTIAMNLKTIAIKVLPIVEKIKVALSVQRKNGKRKITYTPHIKRAVQHLCIHTGGRAVLDTLQEKLKLSDDDMKPSRHVLYKYGNTSSSSIWYELDFLEQEKRVKPKDKVLQLAFGSGFKCNSIVWKKL